MKKSIWKKMFPWLFGVFVTLITIGTFAFSVGKSLGFHFLINEEVSYRFILINQNDKITGYAYYPFREVLLFHQRKNIDKAGITAAVHYQSRLTDWVSYYDFTLTDHVVSKSELSTKVGDVNLPEGFFPNESFGEMKIIFDSPNGNWVSSESITKSKYTWTKAKNSEGEEFEYTVVDIIFWFDKRGWDSHLRDPYNYGDWEERGMSTEEYSHMPR